MSRMRLSILLLFICSFAYALPQGFVYLHDVAPDIIEDMRYATTDNFTGQRVPGYSSPRCILTIQAAKQLKKVQKMAVARGFSLKVFDCYRPQRAVNAFIRWSKKPEDERIKSKYYPREKKSKLFDKGYIAEYSGHSRGSTVDLTLVKKPKTPIQNCQAGTCPKSIPMGTRFDFFDERTHVFSEEVKSIHRKNRTILRQLMIQNGFRPYSKEWWHFTLRQEPQPHHYFNFPVR